jgi:activating signal cointegrator 1
MPMKAISLLQPWASLVVLGAKRFETRTWQTPYRGPLIIHASKRFPEELRDLCGREPFRRILRAAGFASWFDVPLGVLLGTVELMDCLPVGELPALEETERALGDYRAGRWAWRLEQPQALPRLIPWRGMRGLYDVPPHVLHATASILEVAS